MLLLPTVGIRSYGTWVSSTAKMFTPRFTQFGSLFQTLKLGDGHREVCSGGEERWIKMGRRKKRG
jgi:hypothetical protein